jgi:O-antigen/teichoic acid export membrane protein
MRQGTAYVRRPVVRRMAWGVVDQALSSGTNFVVALLVVRVLDAQAFGLFSLSFVTYLLMLGVSRSLISEVYVIRFAALSRRGVAGSAENAVLGGVLLGGFCCAVVFASAAFVVGEPLATPLVAFAIVVPGLLMQDAWRFMFFGRGQPAAAALNDLVWAISQIGLVLVVLTSSEPSVDLLIMAWGASGTFAALFGFVQMRARPDLRGGLAWLRSHRDIGLPRLGQFGLSGGSEQLIVYGIGLVAGLRTVGVIQAADVLFRPLNFVAQGVWVATFPEGVRLRDRSVRALRLSMTAVSGALAISALLAGGFFLVIPEDLGSQLLQQNWPLAQPIIGYLFLVKLFFWIAQGPRMGILIVGAAPRAFRTQLLLTPLNLVANLAGAALGGAQGAVMGGAAAWSVAAVVWWWQFLAASGQHADAADEARA